MENIWILGNIVIEQVWQSLLYVRVTVPEINTFFSVSKPN